MPPLDQAPLKPAEAGSSRNLIAWIALPALLASLLAALALTMVSPSASEPLSPADLLPTNTVTLVAVAPTDEPSGTDGLASAPLGTEIVVPSLIPATNTPAPTVTSTETATPPPTVTPEPTATEVPTNTPEPPPTETPIMLPMPGEGQGVDPITGLIIEGASAQRKPVVAMIDNHPDAAPQSGLNRASMVIEALAEGGITRFETFFFGGDPGTVGPVRSARPYFVEWAYPFQPFIVHCGGSWEAIDLIRESNMLTNVDCFDGNMPFWRSNDRIIPHNLYTDSGDIWQMGLNRGLTAPANMPGFLHSPELPREQRPGPSSIGFDFGTLSPSDVIWRYDPESNDYFREQWGYTHVDADSGGQIFSSNVVVMWTNVFDLPRDYEGRLGTDTIGQNTALIMRDGMYEWGYWKRDTVTSPLELYDGDWQPMALAPGRVWFEVLGIGRQVNINGP